MPTLSKLVSATQTHDTYTHNGAVTNSTSQSHLVDLFFIAWTLIGKKPEDYMQKRHGAYLEDKKLAMKLLFRMRDIRWGAGVRDAFNYIYNQLPDEDKVKYRTIIPVYGRRKDVFELAEQDYSCFSSLIRNYLLGGPNNSDFGLFCKRFPRKGKVFESARKDLWISPKELRKLIVKGSDTVEQKMSSRQREEILYEHVPSKALAKYQKAFERHDEYRFNKFINQKPELVKSTTLFPADIYKERQQEKNYKVIEAQRNNLPDYIQSDKTFLPMIDVSGSMEWSYSSRETGITPIMNSVSLWLYLAQRNKSVFKDAFLSFSSDPKMHYIPWATVCDKFAYIHNDPTMWYSTNIEWAFDLVLDSALLHHLTQKDMPDYILILSDMEFDCPDVGWRNTNFDVIKQKYARAWYEMPNLIFRNLNWRIENVPVTINDNWVALVSGYSPAIMKSVLSCKTVTPYEVMLETLNSERYRLVDCQ